MYYSINDYELAIKENLFYDPAAWPNNNICLMCDNEECKITRRFKCDVIACTNFKFMRGGLVTHPGS